MGGLIPMHRSEPMHAALRAGGRVRGGFIHWIKGAPTHVLAEFLKELEQDGWRLVHQPEMGTDTPSTTDTDDVDAPESTS